MSDVPYPVLPVLLVDDEVEVVSAFQNVLACAHLSNSVACSDPRQVLPLLDERPFGAIVLDLLMPHVSGEDLLREVTDKHPDIPVIVVTGTNAVDTAVRCMKAGAFDYLVKPVGSTRLTSAVSRALELGQVRSEYRSFREHVFRDKLEHPEAFESIVTVSPAMRTIFFYVESIAHSGMPVLIEGESGVGKELLARAIHQASGLNGPLEAVNVAGLEDSVFSDTLFGHVRGAFTGADGPREGLVKKASGGTLVLDEIGDLKPESQVKLLRLLQEREYRPLGSDAARLSTARVVALTNCKLDQLRANGRFRTDLFYRLQTHHIEVPPLRDRREDIPMLATHFASECARRAGREPLEIPLRAIDLLTEYSYPGNVRELEALVCDAVSSSRGDRLDTGHLQRALASRQAVQAPQPAGPRSDGAPFQHLERLPTLKLVHRMLIEEAMRRSNGNQTLAAKLIGISQPGLSLAIKRLRQRAERV